MNTASQNLHDPKPDNSGLERSPLSAEELLQRVNQLAAHYDYGRVKILPDIPTEAKAVLSHVRVAVVDDVQGILAAVGTEISSESLRSIVDLSHNARLLHVRTLLQTTLMGRVSQDLWRARISRHLWRSPC
jgi:hypothetical protein